MAFLPFKLALAFADISIFLLLVAIIVKHSSDKNDNKSYAAGFNYLSMLWLSFRGAFWVLTLFSISSWIGSTFYILYWVPTPICFGAYMLIPIFFANLLYRVEFNVYWEKLRWVYVGTMVSLALFMVWWSFRTAMNLKVEYECIESTSSGSNSPDQSNGCYHTGYSSTPFRFVTAICFLFLALNSATFGKKIIDLEGINSSIFLGPSVRELYNVNLFLFASFLSRGLYEVLEVLGVFNLPDIPLEGDEDVAFVTFLVFVMWDYLPTLLWIVVVTGRDVVYGVGWESASKQRDSYTPIKNRVYNMSQDRLSELNRTGSMEFQEYQDGGGTLPYFYNADGEQMVVVQRATPPAIDQRETSPHNPVYDRSDLLLNRYTNPSSVVALNSWLVPSPAEEVYTGRLNNGSGSGANRSLLYGTFDPPVGSVESTGSGVNPFAAYYPLNSPSMASSPMMKWPKGPPGSEKSPLVDYSNPPIMSRPPNIGIPAAESLKGTSSRFSSTYYETEDAGVRVLPPKLQPDSSRRLAAGSPALGLPPLSIQQPIGRSSADTTPEYPNRLLETVPTGHDYLSGIAASFNKPSMFVRTDSPAFVPPPLSSRSHRSRSNTSEVNPYPVPGHSLSNYSARAEVVGAAHESGHLSSVPDCGMLSTSSEPESIRLSVDTNAVLSSRPKNNLTSSPLAKVRDPSNSSLFASSSYDSNRVGSAGNAVANGTGSLYSLPPPPPSAAAWRQHYFTEDGKYSDGSGTSPPVAAK